MSAIVDQAVQALCSLKEDATSELISIQLEVLYEKSPKFGISPQLIPNLIRYLCETNIISTTTKSYIIEHCLYPNSFLTSQTVWAILEHLGPKTILSPYRIETPKQIQLCLCQWLLYVVFLLPSDIEIARSYWIQLWQYGYLQPYMTFMIIWSHQSIKDIKPWKIELVRAIGANKGYRDAGSNSYLVLNHFQKVVGGSTLIEDAIKSLNYTEHKVTRLQKVFVNNQFHNRLAELLELNHERFNSEYISQLIRTTQVKFGMNSEGIGIRESWVQAYCVGNCFNNVNELVYHWKNSKLPSNIAHLMPLTNAQNSLNSSYRVLYLIKQNTEPGLRNKLKNHITLQFRLYLTEGLNPNTEADFEYLMASSIFFSNMVTDIISELIDVKITTKDLIRFVRLLDIVLPCLDIGHIEIASFRKFIISLVVRIHMANNRMAMIHLMSSIINLLEEGIEQKRNQAYVLTFSQILNDMLKILSSQLNLVSPDHQLLVLISRILRVFSKFPISTSSQAELESLAYPSTYLGVLISYDDSILLNACCSYLGAMRRLLNRNQIKGDLINMHNKQILDLTNYLWRNKVFSSKRLFNIPTNYLKKLADTLSLPMVGKQKHELFTISGIFSLSYVSRLLKHEYETNYLTTGVNYEYNFQEELRSIIGKLKNNATINPNPMTVTEDKKQLIIWAMSMTGSYSDIAFFLFSSLKSLSKMLGS